MNKDPTKRPSLKEILEDAWLQKYVKQPEIVHKRKKSREIKENNDFEIYTTTEDNKSGR